MTHFKPGNHLNQIFSAFATEFWRQKYQILHRTSEKIESTRNILRLNQLAKLNGLWLKMRSHEMLNFDILGEVL